MLGSQKQIIMVIWTLSCVWWISSSTSWKNKARAVGGTAKVCFSTNQVMVVTWGVEISQGAVLRACPSRIASAKSLEKEKKSEQMPSLLQHVHSQGYPEWRRSTLGATFFLEQSDGRAISVIIRETEVSREAVSHTFRCVHIKETRTENKNRMYWWQGWASHGK